MKTVPVNGLEFAYLEEGQGPLVLLAHGFPDTAASWDVVRPALAAAGYRAVSPFMRGYAPTGIPRDGRYDAEALGRDLVGLLEALGDGQPGVVVGHDWGAYAAYAAASLEPARLRLLVTVGFPHPGAIQIPMPWDVWRLRHILYLRSVRSLDLIRKDDFAYLDRLVRRWSPTWEMPGDATRAAKDAFQGAGRLEAAVGYYKAIRWPLPPFLRTKIGVPSVVFAGLHDPVGLGVYRRGARCFSGHHQIVEVPGGHFMHREHPEVFTARLLEGLARFAPVV